MLPPTPVPQWRPGETARDAGATLQTTAQETADFVIWNVIACGPWLLLLAVLGWLGWRWWGSLARFTFATSNPEEEEGQTRPSEANDDA